MICVNIEKMERLRRRKFRTQAELAERAKISLRAYGKIVTRKTLNVGVQTVGRICNALGVKPMTILEYEPDPAE